MLKFAMLFTPSWNKVSKEQIITDDMWKIFHETGKNEAYKDTEEQHMATQWHGVAPPKNGIQWDNVFDDGATLYFYALTMKANYNINQKNRVYASGYFGRDNTSI